MRWTKFAVVMILSAGLQARAAGPDDLYLDIYNQILQAESSLQAGQSRAAAKQFLEAQTELEKLHSDNPSWNPDLIAFRLRYLHDQLQSLSKAGALTPAATSPAMPAPAPATTTPPPTAVAPTPAPTVAPVAPATPSAPAAEVAELKQTVTALQTQVQSLLAANGELQSKLHEALSVQPAAVDPQELAKARENVVQLQKERDSLTALLNEEKAAREKAEASGKAPVENPSGKAKQLAKERDELKKELASKSSELADAQSAFTKERTAEEEASRKLRQVEQERDEAQKRLASTPSEKKQRSSETGSKSDGLRQQNDRLRAELAVLQAAPVPYTSEELALLRKSQPANPGAPPVNPEPVAANAGNVKPVSHSVKDLPAGAGALMAQGMRAAEEGDYANAETKFKEVLRQDENNVYVLARLAQIELAASKFDQCQKDVDRALSLDPNDPGSLYLLGILRYREQKLDAALDALSRSAQYNPTNAGTQNYLGVVLSEKGLRKPAETALRKALEIEPGYKEANYNLSWVYAQEKPPFLALARYHYQRALDEGHPRSEELEKVLGPETH